MLISLLDADEALDAIDRIAFQETNQAADWCKVFAANQGYSKSIGEYFTQ